MGCVRDWLEATACPTLERDRDERVQALAQQMGRFMRHEGRFFSLRETAVLLGIGPSDMPYVQDRVYELTLKFVMQDYAITERDRSGLRWVAKTLKLSPEQARRIELRVGRSVFEQFLAFAISGGYLDTDELQQLRSVADSLKVSTRQFLLGYLADSGEAFLERILAGMAEDGKITDAAWSRLIASAGELGLEEQEFVRVLRPQLRRLANRVPARTRHNSRPDNDTEPALRSLMDRLGVEA